MVKNRPITQEERAAILKDYQRGLSYKVLMAKYNRSAEGISRCVPHEQRRRKHLSKEERQMLFEDRMNGASYKELAKKYGVSRMVVTSSIPKEYRTKRTQTTNRREEAVLSYLEGEGTCRQACGSHKTDDGHVLKLAHDTFPNRFKRFDPEFRMRVVLDATGAPSREIAKLYGINQSTVNKWKRMDRDGTLYTMRSCHLKKPTEVL